MGGVLGGTPKALAPIDGRPFVELQLRFLARNGVRDAVLCTGVGADAIVAELGDGRQLGMRLAYSREREQLGTGGAVREAAALIDGPRFLVLNGDSLVDVALDDLERRHVAVHARATLALARVADAGRYGAVRQADDGAIAEFVEKPEAAGGGLINAGLCLLERDIVELIPAAGPASLERDVFPALVGAGLHGLVAHGAFVDIGTADAYRAVLDAPKDLLRLAGVDGDEPG